MINDKKNTDTFSNKYNDRKEKSPMSLIKISKLYSEGFNKKKTLKVTEFSILDWGGLLDFHNFFRNKKMFFS